MLVWFGQMISLTGTGMTRFAIALWAWELTGSATALALVTFFAYLPALALSPIAGALADRWNRKLVMIMGDSAAGLATIVLLALRLLGLLQIWHVYAAVAFAGAFEAFQYPAYRAAITLMVDKAHYGRTTALMGLANNTSRILAPIFAASLYVFIGLEGILTIDIITFVFAVGTLLCIYVPAPSQSVEGTESRGHLLQEASYGFRYIWQRKPLLGLQTFFFFSNILFAFVLVLVNPYILARTGNDGLQLSMVNAALGIGAVIGGSVIAVCGGFKRQMRGIWIGWLAWSLLGAIGFGLSQSLLVWIALGVAGGFAQPLIDASSQAIWQRKVPPDVQGKIFAALRFSTQVPALASMLLAGLLADNVFEPAMRAGGTLASPFGAILGTEAGAGIALMFVVAGVLEVLLVLTVMSIPAVRNVEEIVQDYDG
ncbi:MAG: MFS transporter [Caldilineaceae bacterium]|nr:MFS transporter [Caldilineaceae bacterium]